MNRRRVTLVAAATTLVGLAGWWLWPEDAPPAARAPLRAGSVLAVPAGERVPTDVLEPGAPPEDEEPLEPPEPPPPPMRVLVLRQHDGLPLPGAQVLLSDHLRFTHFHHHAPRWRAHALTGVDGVAVLELKQAPPEDAKVNVTLLGYGSKLQPLKDGMTVVLEPLPPLDGRVVDAAGEPVPRARVTTMLHKLTTTSDASGRFRLAAPESEVVYAEKDGAWGKALWHDEKEKEVVVSLSPPDVLRRVVDTAGKPLAGVAVDFALGAFPVHVVTAGDGTWGMSKVGASVKVTFSRSGYGTQEQNISFNARPWNVTMTRAARVEGVVVDGDGRPVVGAAVTAMDSAARAVQLKTVSGPGGAFAVDGLGATRIDVLAALGEATGESTVEVPEGGAGKVKVVLRPELVDVELEVVDSTGAQVESYDYSAVATPLPERGWTTKSELGRLPLAKGRFQIDVTADNGAKGSVTLEVDPTEDMPPIKVTLDGPVESLDEDAAPTHTLRVRVKGPTGVPVGGAEVECFNGGGVTANDGTLECKFTPNENAWPLQVRARKGTESGMTRAFNTESELEVVIRAARTIRGRIEGPLPPGKCKMLVNSATERAEEPVAGRTFALENRSPVRTFLCLECYGELESDGASRLGCAVAEPAQDEVVVQAGAPGALVLKVLDSAGHQVEEPIFYVDRTTTPSEQKGEQHTLGVVPGNHVLVVNIEGKRERAEVLFSIRPGEATQLGTVQLR
jgi:Carboxypeptidase regulatory-like domain